MKAVVVKIAVVLGLFNPHYVSFTWQQSTPGSVIVYRGPTGGPWPIKVCNSVKQHCNSHALTPGQTYYFVAVQPGIIGHSNETSAIAR